jgi:hypothetical protein
MGLSLEEDGGLIAATIEEKHNSLPSAAEVGVTLYSAL